MIVPVDSPRDEGSNAWQPPPAVDPVVLARAACEYNDLGWSIIPIKHRNASGKQPACATWKNFQTARPTRDQLVTWFKCNTLHGLAVVLGPVSGGLTCRDFDVREAYDIWAAEHADLAITLPTVATSRGYHVYFCSDVQRIIEYPDGELRGNGYCLLPPSVHPSGSIYSWIDEYDLAEIPRLDPFSSGLGLPGTERTEITEENRSNIRNYSKTVRNDGIYDVNDANLGTSSRDWRRTKCFPGFGIASSESDTQPDSHPLNCSILSVLSVSPQVQELVTQAVEAAQPKSTGHRNLALFGLARKLKGIPALADAPVTSLRPIVRRWHDRALPIIGTKPFEDTWFDFAYGWERVRFPAGTGPLNEILRRADAKPLPAVANNYDAPETRQLIAFCRELQISAGDQSFFLSCRTVADLLNIGSMTAWRRLGALQVDGILEVVEPGTTKRATRFRYRALE